MSDHYDNKLIPANINIPVNNNPHQYVSASKLLIYYSFFLSDYLILSGDFPQDVPVDTFDLVYNI